jgi:hypothetical protein
MRNEVKRSGSEKQGMQAQKIAVRKAFSGIIDRS